MSTVNMQSTKLPTLVSYNITLAEQLSLHKNNYSHISSMPALNTLYLSVSFVIPVYNSATSLRACIASIANQQRADLIREIIIINDGSTDESLAILKQLKLHYPQIIIIANTVRRGAAFSRNRGIEHATGNLVCFIDSDIILPQTYLTWHIAQHQHDTSCITFSLRTNIDSVDEVKDINTHTSDFRAPLLEKANKLIAVDFQFSETHSLAELCLTCAVTYRREDLLTIKGCPQNFVGWGYNDTAMAAKAIALGRSVAPLPQASVFHLIHQPRSGSKSKKWQEFTANEIRYKRLLALPARASFRYYIPELEK